MNAAELARIARNDLTTIIDLARWAHTDGWTRNTPNPDAPRRAPKAVPDAITIECPTCHGLGLTHDDEHRVLCATCGGRGRIPDQVPGDTYDLGIASHPSRRAWQESVPHIAEAERYVAFAVVHTLGDRPRLLKPTPASELAIVIRTAQLTRSRLGRLEHTNGNPAPLKAATRHTGEAWTALYRAFTIGKANPGESSEDLDGVVTERCRICAKRPRAVKAGGRCNTCATWFHRKGYERPSSLDSLDDVHQAQARRIGRGDSWGDESLSATAPLRPPDPVITGRRLLGPIPEPR